MPRHRTEAGPGWELRLGPWQEVMQDVLACDLLLADLPYSERTHKGFRSGGVTAGSISDQVGIIEYDPLAYDDAAEYVASWSAAATWMVLFGDHITQAWLAAEMELCGRYVFAPVPWIRLDAPPRFSGDGPQRSAEWITVSRLGMQRVGSLSGHYLVRRVEGKTNGSQLPGQKNLAGIRKIVREYSRPGALVVDTHAGTGTTLLAAATEGRTAIGSERDPATFEIALRRLRGGYTPDLFVEAEAR